MEANTPNNVIRHGTRSRYIAGCRCEACVEKNRRYHLKERWRRRCYAELGIEPPHGLSGYQNHGCRCDICKAAKAEQNRKRYRNAEDSGR